MSLNWAQQREREADRKRKRIADLKSWVAASEVPISQELSEALNRLFITDFINVMRCHPGFATEDKLRSLKTTFVLFKCACKDLRGALDKFDTISKKHDFADASNRAARDELENTIRKELYCFSSLAHSLQDHCRRLKADWKPDEFEAHLVACFGSDGLHDFICGLRTALHHRSMVEADWLLRGSDTGVTSHYVLEKHELVVMEKAWNVAAKHALKEMSAQIDVRELSEQYFSRADKFYTWLFERSNTEPAPAMLSYRRCWHDHEVQSAQLIWRAMIRIFTQQKVDPYAHLQKYLESAQLKEVMALPMHSKEQVDRIISCVDQLGACTEEIRQDAYTLFNVGQA